MITIYCLILYMYDKTTQDIYVHVTFLYWLFPSETTKSDYNKLQQQILLQLLLQMLLSLLLQLLSIISTARKTKIEDYCHSY